MSVCVLNEHPSLGVPAALGDIKGDGNDVALSDRHKYLASQCAVILERNTTVNYVVAISCSCNKCLCL